ncbi:hypothetical protein BGZ80_000033 [Entomortierella chlamydospora]|uniref:Major facilitator superfamily (MFS) profile domain-containing protein n=1 Tax=Entomortierella chlamydospora TaxID=101097 RepID=A0A9P6N285_9FUNG|nr:hypothetical protein BGZ80_000033 [Entomortierella chlamydospora]
MVRLNDPLTQVIILVSSGSYGLDAKDSDVGNKAGQTFSVVFAFSSLFAGALFNAFGHRILLVCGGLMYVLYIGSFLAYHHIQSMTFVYVASVFLGLGAGWLWTAQGAIMLGYPEEGDKGKYFSIFWGIFNLGAVIGNFIPVGLAWNDPDASGASDGAYIAYMAIMVVGAFLSTLLLPASKIVRKDGTNVTVVKYSSPLFEIKSILGLFADWRMLVLFPMFFASNWFYTYQFTYNTLNFTVRTRSLNSAIYWLAQIIASVLFGAFLDRHQWSRPTRARYGLILLTLILIAIWIGGIINQRTFGPRGYIIDPTTGTAVKNPADYHMIDAATSAYAGPFFLYFFFGAADAMYQGYSYWLMGALTNDPSQAGRFAGFYKFAQNIGAVLAPLVQLSTIGIAPKEGHNIMNATGRGMGEIIVCVVLVFVGIIGAIPVAFRAVKDHTVEDGDVNEKNELEHHEEKV